MLGGGGGGLLGGGGAGTVGLEWACTLPSMARPSCRPTVLETLT